MEFLENVHGRRRVVVIKRHVKVLGYNVLFFAGSIEHLGSGIPIGPNKAAGAQFRPAKIMRNDYQRVGQIALLEGAPLSPDRQPSISVTS